MTAQYFARSRRWGQLREPTAELVRLIGKTDRLDEVAEASTRQLLELLGWRGEVVRSSALTARSGRSERLADLVAAVGATTYLCGTGGARYLDNGRFTSWGYACSTPPSRTGSATLCGSRAAISAPYGR